MDKMKSQPSTSIHDNSANSTAVCPPVLPPVLGSEVQVLPHKGLLSTCYLYNLGSYLILQTLALRLGFSLSPVRVHTKFKRFL